MLWELTWIHISLFSQTFGLEKLSATSCQDNPLFSIFKTFNVGNWWSPFSRWSIRPNTNLWISLYNTSVRTVSNFTSLQSMMWSLVRKLWGNLPDIKSPDTKNQAHKHLLSWTDVSLSGHRLAFLSKSASAASPVLSCVIHWDGNNWSRPRGSSLHNGKFYWRKTR